VPKSLPTVTVRVPAVPRNRPLPWAAVFKLPYPSCDVTLKLKSKSCPKVAVPKEKLQSRRLASAALPRWWFSRHQVS